MYIKKHEIIGKQLEVVDALNKNLIGLKGEVVDETKESFIIEQLDKTRRQLLKADTVLDIDFNNNAFRIMGNELRKKPEER